MHSIITFSRLAITSLPRLAITSLHSTACLSGAPKPPLTTHYDVLKVTFCNNAGAIVGLTALGHQGVRNALYPNLQPYLALLQEQMQQSGNEMKRYEAYKCFGALLHAAGAAIRDRVK